jgi:hypothetical protein
VCRVLVIRVADEIAAPRREIAPQDVDLSMAGRYSLQGSPVKRSSLKQHFVLGALAFLTCAGWFSLTVIAPTVTAAVPTLAQTPIHHAQESGQVSTGGHPARS